MRHAQIRRTLTKRLASVIMGILPVTLYPFQEEGLSDKLVPWLKKRKASHRAYYSWATGLGKTVQFSVIAKACAGHLRTLVIVPTKVLVSQTVKKLALYTNGQMGHISSNPAVLDHDGEIISLRTHKHFGKYELVVCTDESFKSNHERILEELDPEVIIWDECHWGYSELAQKALSTFDEALVLAFSATPDYLTTVCKQEYIPVTLDNGQVLYAPPDRMAREHFGDRLDERTVRWGIENGYLAPFAWGRIEFKVSLKGIGTSEGPAGPDYDQASLHKLLSKNWKSMVKVVRKLYESGQYDLKNRSTVAICPGVAQAEKLASAMNRIGVPSACISGATSDDERDALLKAFDRGEIKLLTSIFVLREGWDTDKAEVCLMLRPTKSRVLYVQFMGRVLRLDKANPDKVALVLDPLFQDANFAPLSAPILFGLPGQEVRDGDFVIRPKRKHGRDTSPYLLDRLHPVLVVEKPAIEYWTNEEGTVVIDGVVYSTVTRYIRQRLGDSGGAKKLAFSRIKQHKLVPRYGRRRAGNVEQFYAISDLDRICADLLEPRADEDGILVIDGKKFITAGRYVKQVGAGKAEVPKKIKQQNLVYRIGRDAKGDRRKFYALSELDRIYRDYSNTERAGQDGVLVIDGVACITVGPFAVSIGARDDTVQRYIDKYGLRPRKGTDSRGHERDFYIVTELDQACCGYLLRKRSSAKQRG